MKILLIGATGAMGKIIAQLITEEDTVEIAAGVGAHPATANFPVYSNFEGIKEDFDCIIDFSNKSLTPALLRFIQSRRKRAVIATTGLSPQLLKQIHDLSQSTPILYAQNMSVGINAIDTLVAQLSKVLEDFDIEIIEKHHHHKLDAPSGTAELLFNTIKATRKKAYMVKDRSLQHQKRDPAEVGVLSLRGGSIVGEHSVIFAGTDEVIEIKHTALSKKIFGKGAIKAARFLMEKEKGLYTMKDVLA